MEYGNKMCGCLPTDRAHFSDEDKRIYTSTVCTKPRDDTNRAELWPAHVRKYVLWSR